MPLRGENFDGHNFIDKAIEQGAIGYFTQDKFKINKNAKFVLCVQNSLMAYLKLANYIRNKINPIVVAITGPDATPGSNLSFLSIRGVHVPIIVAIVMFNAIAIPTMSPS